MLIPSVVAFSKQIVFMMASQPSTVSGKIEAKVPSLMVSSKTDCFHGGITTQRSVWYKYQQKKLLAASAVVQTFDLPRRFC